MANKAISELPQAQNVNNQDLFVLEQSGIAKKLPAETFITEQGIINALAEALDGHGGIQSVTLSSVSGRIRTYRITFSDGSATTFQVYDGTSIDRISRTSSSGLDDVYTVFLSDGTTTFFTVHNGADGDVSEAMLNDALKDKAPAITETTESSAIATFSDGADDMVMHNIVAEINPVQSGSGDPSPSNIRPISGWTGCNVTRIGANLYSVDNGAYNVPVYGADGTIGSYPDVHAVWIPVKPNTTYTVANAGTESTPFYVRWINCTSDKSFISRPGGTFNSAQLPQSFLTPSNCYWVEVAVNQYQASQISKNDWEISVIATADTTYEPYQGNTVSVDWTSQAGIVYGGTIDVATGLLTVDYALVTINGTNYPIGTTPSSASGTALVQAILPDIALVDQYDSSKVVSDYLPSTTDYSIYRNASPAVAIHPATPASHRRLWLRLPNITTEADAKTYLANNPLTVVYALATPQTYQLTPQEVKTLFGTNNVWADTGNVLVTYAADTKLYIEKLTQPTEDDLVANQAITSGKYFMIGNSLYLALANIASGAQITIGTNAQRVSLADALNTINS